MPSRARRCAGRSDTSRPPKQMEPPSAETVPAIRLKTELLPAPFGPITPRHCPGSREKVTLSATMIAPYAFLRLVTSRSAGISNPSRAGHVAGAELGPRSGKLREELEVGFHRDLRRGGVGDDEQLEGELAVLRLAPLTARPARERHVLDGAVLELHRAHDGVDGEIGDRALDGVLVLGISGVLERCQPDLPDRVRVADGLRPL